jgi:predicted transcriptional regulator
VLQVLMGCSTQEIADALGLTQGAVLTRLHRARNQLHELLDPGLQPDSKSLRVKTGARRHWPFGRNPGAVP